MANKKTTRILSKKDDVGHSESLKTYKHFRKSNSGLILTDEEYSHQQDTCGFCGHTMKNQLQDVWFEDFYHSKCVEKMKRGEQN